MGELTKLLLHITYHLPVRPKAREANEENEEAAIQYPCVTTGHNSQGHKTSTDAKELERQRQKERERKREEDRNEE